MLRVVILYKTMPNRVNSLKEGHKTSLQNARKEKGIHFPFTNAKCCSASMADPCPNVDFVMSLFLIAHASLLFLLISLIIWQKLVSFDVQPSCCLHFKAVLVQTKIPCLDSNFCNSHPVVSSNCLIILAYLLLDDSLHDVWRLRGLSGPWLARESPCLLISEKLSLRRQLLWLCTLPRSNSGQFPRSFSLNASSRESSTSHSLKTPS